MDRQMWIEWINGAQRIFNILFFYCLFIHARDLQIMGNE